MEYASEAENYLVFFFPLQNSYANRRAKNTRNMCLPLGCANLCNSLLRMHLHTNSHNLYKHTGKLEALQKHVCMFLSIQLCYVGFNSINRKCKFIHTLNHTDERPHLHTLHNSFFFFFVKSCECFMFALIRMLTFTLKPISLFLFHVLFNCDK